MTIVQIYEDAGALLLERGWCKGNFENEHGEFCLLGAMATVHPDLDDTYRQAKFILRELINQPLHQWNDSPGRTRGDVLELLTQGIIIAGGGV